MPGTTTLFTSPAYRNPDWRCENVTHAKIHGGLAGAFVGDFMGMPWETMRKQQIMHATNGVGVKGPVGPVQRAIVATQSLKIGDYTDDWQLTAVMARSLLATGGRLNLQHCANAHIEALEKTIFGWGKGTIQAIQGIRDGKRKFISNHFEELPLPSANEGAGNGVIMKVFPLAISEVMFSDIDDHIDGLLLDCICLGSMTHPDYRAILAAYAVAYTMCKALTRPRGNPLRFIDILDIINFLHKKIKRWELGFDEARLGGNHPSVSYKLGVLCELLTIHGRNVTIANVAEAVGSGFVAWETAAFVLGAFACQPSNFEEALGKTIDEGGDTDSNASILGTLIGANVGVEVIPKEWMAINPEIADAKTFADEFMELFRMRYSTSVDC